MSKRRNVRSRIKRKALRKRKTIKLKGGMNSDRALQPARIVYGVDNTYYGECVKENEIKTDWPQNFKKYVLYTSENIQPSSNSTNTLKSTVHGDPNGGKMYNIIKNWSMGGIFNPTEHGEWVPLDNIVSFGSLNSDSDQISKMKRIINNQHYEKWGSETSKWLFCALKQTQSESPTDYYDIFFKKNGETGGGMMGPDSKDGWFTIDKIIEGRVVKRTIGTKKKGGSQWVDEFVHEICVATVTRVKQGKTPPPQPPQPLQPPPPPPRRLPEGVFEYDRTTVINILTAQEPGTFIIRLPSTENSKKAHSVNQKYTLSINVNGDIKHAPIYFYEDMYRLVENPSSVGFKNLDDLVAHFRNNSISDYSKAGVVTDLKLKNSVDGAFKQESTYDSPLGVQSEGI